jgi:translation initiation factor 2 alpha subunit (eIF-2alpha)
MVKKGVSPEEKAKAFELWKESDEYKSIIKWLETRAKDDDIDKLDNAYKDIWQEWQPIMDDLYNMCDKMKVPGRKAKCRSVSLTLCSVRAVSPAHDVLRAC